VRVTAAMLLRNTHHYPYFLTFNVGILCVSVVFYMYSPPNGSFLVRNAVLHFFCHNLF
jgi:hypothetical protein